MNKLAQIDIGRIFGSRYGSRDPGGQGIADFVSTILFNAVAIAGVILFILIIYGGITLTAGAGSGNKEDIAKGQKAVTNALFGFLIIFISYWIIVILERIFSIRILYPLPY